MTEEIKEIFYKLKSDDYYEEHYQQSVYYERDLKKLENYITNLQKENEILRENAEHNDKVVDKAKWNEMIYKQRNEKAIEYINNLRDESAEREGFYNCFPDDLYIADIEVLLNILEGGDE